MATINGTNANNTINGTASADIINGLGGNDLLHGLGGNDTIDGGTGADQIWGEDGDDILKGGSQTQNSTENGFIYGGNGNDIIYGGGGDDKLYGDAGTDTIKGENGHDTIKGGSGISFLYGGVGHDTFFYAPTTDNIAKLKQYLSGSIINGDDANSPYDGWDTLNLQNDSTYTSGTTQKATATHIQMSDGVGYISFVDPNGNSSSAGTFKEIEALSVTGSGGLRYEGDYYSSNTSMSVVGTAVNDTFRSYYGNDIMKGGAGNDTFYSGGGFDQIRSETNDADIFRFEGYGGNTVVEGFNGAGIYAGDRMYIEDYYLTNPDAQITEDRANGLTTFNLGDGGTIQVVALGLVEGVDWFGI